MEQSKRKLGYSKLVLGRLGFCIVEALAVEQYGLDIFSMLVYTKPVTDKRKPPKAKSSF